MLDNVKDQEMLNYIHMINSSSISEARIQLTKLNIPLSLREYNSAYLDYANGDYLMSLFHLENSYYSGMESEGTKKTIEHLKQKLDLEFTQADQSSFDRFILSAKTYPEELFPTLSIIFLIFGGILLLKNKISISLIPLCFGIIFLGSFYIAKDFQIALNYSEVPIYRGPSKIFEEVQVLPIGEKILYSQKTQDWKFINYPEMYRGWVYKNKVLNL